MTVTNAPETLRALLADARVIAILGAHDAPSRAGFYVPDYLARQGYRVLPINPGLVGRTLWGEPVRAALTELPVAVDIVDVFRGSRHLAGHVDEILAMGPRPPCVWFQLGIRDDAVAHQLAGHGITVVQDRCTLAEHRHFGLPPVGPPVGRA